MRINPYTGEPLPDNQYMPTSPDRAKIEKVKTLKYGVAGVDNLLRAPTLNNGIEVPEVGGQASKMDIAGNLASGAGEILNFGAEQYANFQNTAASTKESQSQMIAGTMKGAQVGMSVGGPWGAAIGGVAGATMGFIDLKRDQKERVRQGDTEHSEMLDRTQQDRKRTYQVQKGEQASAMAMNTYGKQEKFYNPYG